MRQSSDWLTIDRIHCETKRAGEIVAGCLLVGASLSTFLGFAVIGVYLGAYSIPFMLFDASFSFALQVIGIQFFYWTFLFTVYCFIPLLVPFILRISSASETLPHLSAIRRSDKERKEGGFVYFFLEYILFFLPVYMIMATVLVFYLVGVDPSKKDVTLNIVFSGSFLLGVLSLLILNLARKSKGFDIVGPFLWINIVSVLWVLLICERVGRFMFGENYTPTYTKQEYLVSFVLIFVPLIAHFLLTWLRSGARVVVVAPVLLLLAVQLLVGFQAFGGFVLREAGAGGGTPIDFITTQTGRDPQHGCLILATSMYFYIEPVEANKPCATLVQTAFSGTNRLLKKPLQNRISAVSAADLRFPGEFSAISRVAESR